MKALKLILIAFFPLMLACSGNGNSGNESAKVDEPTDARSYVDSNSYIDVDIEELAKAQATSGPDSIDKSDIAKAKAAIYRFYKNVDMKDGKYSCSASKGSDINVSDKVFGALLNNLNDMNRWLEEAKERGDSVITFTPDSAYLESLLK